MLELHFQGKWLKKTLKKLNYNNLFDKFMNMNHDKLLAQGDLEKDYLQILVLIFYYHSCYEVKDASLTPHKMTTLYKKLEQHPLYEKTLAIKELDVQSHQFGFVVLVIKAVMHKEEQVGKIFDTFRFTRSLMFLVLVELNC